MNLLVPPQSSHFGKEPLNQNWHEGYRDHPPPSQAQHASHLCASEARALSSIIRGPPPLTVLLRWASRLLSFRILSKWYIYRQRADVSFWFSFFYRSRKSLTRTVTIIKSALRIIGLYLRHIQVICHVAAHSCSI